MADKKITELPYIDTLSGSLVGTNTPLQNTVIPLVLRGNTNQINIENFSKFVTAYSATTGSNAFIGNQTVNGNVTVTGKITAQEFFTEITSASIIFESGSSLFGNSGDDTHTFTGSMLTTGSIILNGSAIGTGQLNVQTASQDLVNRGISSVTGSINTTTSSFNSVFLQISSTTGSINTQSSSQDLVNRQISSTTGSINTTTSSFDSVFLRISSTTGSINTTTSSFDSVFLRISSTTGSINTTTSSFDSVFLQISSTTGSINTQSSSQDLVNRQISSTTGSINTTTSSFDSVFLRISSTTGSINTTTSSFDSVFLRISSTTGSINTTTSSFDLVFRGISSVTGAINTQSSSQDLVNFRNSTFTSSLNFTTASLNSFTGSVIGQTNTISTFTSSVNFATQSLNTQTGSQESMNTALSIVTGSMRAEIGGIEAYTASLKGAIVVNGTNVRIIGELTASRIYTEYITSSVLFVTGSNIIGDQITDKHEFTGSVNINNALYVNGELYVNGQATGTGELNAFTGSQIGKDFTLSKVTASIDAHILKQATQTGSQDLVNLGISTYTGSQNVINTSVNAHILKQAIQTGSQDLVNLGVSSVTGSLIGITNGLMAFTAALDNTYATDAQLYQLYQSTASIQFATASLNTQTGSQDIVNFNISVVTSSIDSHILKQATQTGSQDLVNLGISTFTGSLRSEVNGIEAYTASLKGAIEVSGQNVNVLGTLTAQEIYTTYVTSSVLFQSGSTKFGNSSDDRHEFTGSLFVTGSSTFNTNAAKIIEIQSATATGGYVRFTYNGSSNSIGYIGNSNQLSGVGAVNDFELRADNNLTLTAAAAISLSTPSGSVYQVRSTNGASGDHIFKSYNTQILKLDGATNAATFIGSVTAPSVNVVYNNTLTGQTADDVTLATYTAGASNELLQITIVLTNTNATGQVRATLNYTDDANHSVSTGTIATTPNAANGVGQDVVALNIKSGTTLTIKSLITVGAINYNSRVAITKIL